MSPRPLTLSVILTLTLITLLAPTHLLPAAAAPAPAPAPTRAEKATQVAEAWVRAMLKGHTAVTTALSDVPFAWDRKETIESLAELEKRFAAITREKGSRDTPVRKVEVIRDQTAPPKDAAPADAVVVKAWLGDQFIDIAVQPGDAYRVVGFSD